MDLFGQLIGAYVVRLKDFVEWFGARRKEIAGVGMPITRDRSQNSDRHGVVGADEAAAGFRIARCVDSWIGIARSIRKRWKAGRLKIADELLDFVRRGVTVVVDAGENMQIVAGRPKELSPGTPESRTDRCIVQKSIVGNPVLASNVKRDLTRQFV